MKFKVGDKVRIKDTFIEGTITKDRAGFLPGTYYPYQVGNSNGFRGICSEDELELVKESEFRVGDKVNRKDTGGYLGVVDMVPGDGTVLVKEWDGACVWYMACELELMKEEKMEYETGRWYPHDGSKKKPEGLDKDNLVDWMDTSGKKYKKVRVGDLNWNDNVISFSIPEEPVKEFVDEFCMTSKGAIFFESRHANIKLTAKFKGDKLIDVKAEII